MLAASALSFFIVNKQYTLFAPGQYPGVQRFCFRIALNTWEEYLEGRPLARLAVDDDGALMSLDDAMDNRKPHPRSFTRFLGRKKGIEYSLHHFLIHAMPCIAYDQLEVWSRFQIEMFAQHAGINLDILHTHLPSPSWHGPHCCRGSSTPDGSALDLP